MQIFTISTSPSYRPRIKRLSRYELESIFPSTTTNRVCSELSVSVSPARSQLSALSRARTFAFEQNEKFDQSESAKSKYFRLRSILTFRQWCTIIAVATALILLAAIITTVVLLVVKPSVTTTTTGTTSTSTTSTSSTSTSSTTSTTTTTLTSATSTTSTSSTTTTSTTSTDTTTSSTSTSTSTTSTSSTTSDTSTSSTSSTSTSTSSTTSDTSTSSTSSTSSTTSTSDSTSTTSSTTSSTSTSSTSTSSTSTSSTTTTTQNSLIDSVNGSTATTDSWTESQYSYTALSSGALTLQFTFQTNNQCSWCINNVSVLNPLSTEMLTNGDFDSSPSLTGWTTNFGSCNTTYLGVTKNQSHASTQSFCDDECDGETISISQSFAAIAGDVYNVTFWYYFTCDNQSGSSDPIELLVTLN